MRVARLAAALVLCAACAPLGGHVVEVGGTRYAVFSSGGWAEAHRLSPEPRPDRRGTVLKGLLAIEAATGCGIRPGGWSGDTAVIRAALDCGEPPPPVHAGFCTVTTEWPIPALGTSVAEMDCVATGN